MIHHVVIFPQLVVVFENNADGKFIQPDIVEPVQSFIHQNPFSLRTPSVQITSSTMEAVVVNINRKIKKFGLRISTYTPEQLTSGTLQYHMSEMNDVRTIYEDLSIDISEFLDNYRPNLSEEDIQRWDAVLVELQSKFKTFKLSFLPILNELNASSVQSNSVHDEQIKLLREQNEISKLNQQTVNEQSVKVVIDKRATAVKKAKAKIENLTEDIEELSLKANKVEDWTTQTDLSICRAMKENSKLQKGLDQIISTRRDLENSIAEYDLSDEIDNLGLTECDHRIQDITSEVKATIEAVEKEDDSRELYSLDELKADKVKLPTFGGKPNEDYAKFKLELNKAFSQNRITRADKLNKLRECLFGSAKRLLPSDTVTSNIDEAWKVLDNAFGKSSQLMMYRKDALYKMGPLPKQSDKGGWKSRVEWLIEVQSLMESLLVLSTTDRDCAAGILCETELAKIPVLFPDNMATQLRRCSGEWEVKLKNMIEKVAEFRKDAQESQLGEQVALREGIKPYRDRTNDGGGTASGHRNPNKTTSQAANFSKITGFEMPSLISYKPPQRDENCRICNKLNEKGDTNLLYDNHNSNFPTGCPRYIGMTVKERSSIAKAAALCLRCHDPSYVYKKGDKTHGCIIKNRNRSRYTCSDPSCTIHMWCCTVHIQKNTERLKKFQEEIRAKFNLEFCFVAIPLISKNYSPIGKQIHTKRSDGSGPNPNSSSSSVHVKAPTSQANQADCNSSGSNERRKSLSTNEAMNKLKKKLTKEGLNQQLRPIAKGRPQFMLGTAQGKTRPLLHLYDNGCGSILFREGVPQKELSGCVLKTKGPFNVRGVGDTAVKVNDEYMVTMSLVDGTRQILQGWTMDRITDTLPFVDLRQAEADIKASQPGNTNLQSLHCQPQVGGEVDVLLGILYNNIHPEAVHSLDNGLTIYRMRITPHDPKFNAVIGGPHESFQFMAQEFGGIGIMFTNLSQQLESFKKFGPPTLQRSVMSNNDVLFARTFNEWDFSLVDTASEFNQEENSLHEVAIPYYSKQADTKTESTKVVEIDSRILSCSCCGIEISAESANALDALIANTFIAKPSTEEDQLWKQFQKAQTDGLNIDYRCPKCRSCSHCRRSFETERVSLREETEDLMIWDSVHIDWKNKQIVCYLPLRGREEEFLSNNRDIALKILDQQCNKYAKDQETRNSVVKAFEKLRKHGQLVFWKDLSEEERKFISSKPISHYLVWRVVFKDSLSTPSRPVFDGSQKTKLLEDGSGGRCLNDAVVKGRITTLNLVKMVLRFCMGKFATQGDLKQFYASIKLTPEQWHLQRVLYRENLDPSSEVKEAIIKTLIWGIKSISAQSECAIIKLADSVKSSSPELADFLLNSRFVDDLGDSSAEFNTLKKKTVEADELCSKVGLACKGWSFTGFKPPEDVCEEGDTVSIGGMKWHTMLDLLEVPVPQLHFGKKVRGKLLVGTQVFEGSMVADMEQFVPQNLTRRMLFSKKSGFFDILGKFTPIDIRLKLDLRDAVALTTGWDDPIPSDLRKRWVDNFWQLEKLRGIKFKRARMPSNAVSSKMDLIASGDAAKEVKITGVWGRFQLDDGTYSCQNLIGRSLLADDTIPKNELEGLTMTSNLTWILRQSLENWISDYIVLNDSMISLCWTKSDKKRLSLFHRNRTVQIRRGIDLNNLYHVVSEANPADIGTRPYLVKESDVGPQSKWELGLPWMRGEISLAISSGY